jgi:hypothetical protein
LDPDTKDEQGRVVVQLKGYDKAYAKVGVPALLLLDKQGHVLRVAKLPETTAGIDGLIKEVTGQ